jgi:hypothetical protein
MKKWIQRILIAGLIFFALLAIFFIFLVQKDVPEKITYGISYNVPYIHELGLSEDDVLDALLNELEVRDFRMSAHWTLTEPERNQFEFAWMDRDLKKVEKAGGHVIFGVGRRLPRWPECHVPLWAKSLTQEEQQSEILEYITAVVLRYKDSPAITHWQVENEPYLGLFAHDHCGDLDESFLEKEIALVKSLDPSRPVLITDSGNLGTWKGAYSHGDSFGTSVYVYFWNPELGQFKTVLPPWFYRAKENFLSMFYGEKETFLIELSLEPWLLEPVTAVPVDVQYSRMDREKFDEIIEYARETRYEKQYLWGGEWWYWLREHGHPEMWERGSTLFHEGV